jgi:predicted Rossmann fold nucleotide-binding protein DprA/Smf involved in DNA uptake
MMKHERTTALLALQFSPPVLFCNGSNLETVTDAVDGWRQFSKNCERLIRDSFGQVRHSK